MRQFLYIINSQCINDCVGCYLKNQKSFGDRNINSAIKDIVSIKDQGYGVGIDGSNVLNYPQVNKLIELADFNYLLINYSDICKNPLILHGISPKIEKIMVTSSLSTNVLTRNDKQFNESIKLIAMNGFTPIINYIIGEDNHQFLDTMIQEAIDVGVNKIRFLRYIPQSFSDKKVLLENHAQEFLDNIKRIKNSISIETLDITIAGQFGTYWRRHKGEVCFAGDEYLTIGLNNIIYPCDFLMQEGFELGQILDGKVMLKKKLNGLSRYDCKAKQIYQDKKPFSIELIAQ